ncbi:MAG TPA: hypothetical protein VMG81_00810 [Thermoplasmata archaeon]|nr:hypothetical protein [Thermoplasmata archaeon]
MKLVLRVAIEREYEGERPDILAPEASGCVAQLKSLGWTVRSSHSEEAPKREGEP